MAEGLTSVITDSHQAYNWVSRWNTDSSGVSTCHGANRTGSRFPKPVICSVGHCGQLTCSSQQQHNTVCSRDELRQKNVVALPVKPWYVCTGVHVCGVALGKHRLQPKRYITSFMYASSVYVTPPTVPANIKPQQCDVTVCVSNKSRTLRCVGVIRKERT